MANRKVADCRKMPSDNNCSVTITGREEEVVPLTIHHMMDVHGHKDSPELREEVLKSLTDE